MKSFGTYVKAVLSEGFKELNALSFPIKPKYEYGTFVFIENTKDGDKAEEIFLNIRDFLKTQGYKMGPTKQKSGAVKTFNTIEMEDKTGYKIWLYLRHNHTRGTWTVDIEPS